MASDHQLQAAQMFNVWMFIIACVCTLLMSSSQGEEELVSSGLAADMQALLAIKSSLKQEKPTPILIDWVANSSSPCAWSRITCNPSPWLANQTRVTSLDLSSLGINGSLPSAFSNLTALSSLNLSYNSITGPLSQDNIANCTHLSSLDLSSNKLSTVSTASDGYQGLKNLINLQYLHLGNNNISSNDTFTLALPLMCAQLHYLNLSHNSLHLDLSQAYSWHDCSSLHTLDLSYNQYTGSLPSNLTSLPSLQVLLLSKNNLVGTIPTSMCSINSSSLHSLDLSANHIDGSFPLSLLQCLSLQNLDISANNMTGSIPSQVGQMVSLEVLNLAENFFTGSLPGELGNLANLKVFMAGSNKINGSIPPQLTNCKKLILMGLDSNSLQGTLPDFLGDMVSLEYISVHSNAFSGTIPLALLNPFSNLRLLDLSTNKLSGEIPVGFANLTSLQYLMLAENIFTGAIPSEIGSIAGLQILDLSSNHLSDQIPSSLGHLQHLLWLNLAFNNLTSPIPPQLGNCTSLLWLNLKSNSLSGLLPSELSSMGMDPSKTFKLNANISLYPPKTLGECSVIKRWVPEEYPPYSFVYDILDRDTCKSYWLVLLTKSPFDEECSVSVRTGVSIAAGYIQLSNNKLTGPIVYNLQANRTIFLLLSFNRINGSLPGGLSQLPLLALNASHNLLDGSIPDSLADNKCLTSLDLSYNNLSGSIPASLASLAQLSTLNLSFNPFLSGAIPSGGQFTTFSAESYLNDSLLCLEDVDGMRQNSSTLTHLPFCNSGNSSLKNAVNGRQSKGSSIKLVIILIAGILSCLVILLCGAIAFIHVMWKWPNYRSGTSLRKYDDDDVDGIIQRDYSKSVVRFFKESSAHGSGKSSITAPIEAQFTYTDLLLATNNFSDEHVIGCGGFGTVYKAKLRDGSMVAIKKLHMERGTSEQGEREFMAEMETLGTITHENLVPLIACCRCGSEKLLVYKLMSNGSLEDWLHGEERGRYVLTEEMDQKERERDEGEDEETLIHSWRKETERSDAVGEEKLSWDVRVKIAKGCAKALVYLHQECTIIHRDVKASNVLLDEDFNAYVTDFGLARELPPGLSHVSTVIAGTLGYVAPEYWHTWHATTKGDVYSFGVVLLELLTGQPPVTYSSARDGSLVDWVRLLDSQSRPAEAWHPIVRRTAAGRLHHVLAFMRLALACTSDRPQQRPCMQEVALILQDMH